MTIKNNTGFMRIYVKPIEGLEIKSVKDLIDTLYRNNSTTIRYAANETYKDKNLTKRQCHQAIRSFDDLLRIARTRFPDTSEKELMGVLKELNFSVDFCYDVRKFVFTRQYGNADYLTPQRFNGWSFTKPIKTSYTAQELANICKGL
jgi:hypothetical protein